MLYTSLVTGYSKKTLREKLGLKSGASAVILYAPLSYIEELGDIDDVMIFTVAKKGHDFIHYFVKDKNELVVTLPKLLATIRETGMIWVSWPKKSSGVSTNINEQTIRDIALPIGLVDIKVAAIDETWSGLKLVIRKKHR